MATYAQKDVDDLDPQEESVKIVDFLKAYRSQIVFGLVLEEMAKDKGKFDKWKKVDGDVKDAFTRLQSSTSKYLKEANPSMLFRDPS